MKLTYARSHEWLWIMIHPLFMKNPYVVMLRFFQSSYPHVQIHICNSKSVPLMILNYMTNYFFWYISIPWNIDVWTIDVSSKRENLWLQKYHDIYPVNHLDRQISKHIIDDHICLKGNNEGCVLWTEIINLFFTISFLIPHSLNAIVAK